MIHHGDALEVLRTLPEASVQCCVTSPPYWGLRDYGVPGQIGLERTPAEYVAGMVAVFDEVRRVLKPDGVLWLNLGDSYATGAGSVKDHPGGGKQGAAWAGRGDRPGSPKHTEGAMGPTTQPNRMPLPGLKPKDLIGIPWRVAFALQEAGWYLRCDVIWSKPNPMPESVQDRPTRAHEYIFLFSKNERYFYDSKAIAEPGSQVSIDRLDRARLEGWAPPGSSPHRGSMGARAAKPDKQRGHGRRHAGFNDRWDEMERAEQTGVMRNKRSVWNIATRPFTEWGETSRRVRVALDEIDGDTKRTTSPDCPLHGDHAAPVPNASCGEREGASPSHTERTSARLAPEPSSDSAPTGSLREPDSVAESSGYSSQRHAQLASGHSSGSRRKGRAPETIPPCTPSDESPFCIGRTEEEPDSSGSADRTSESNNEPDDSAGHPSARSSFRNEDSLCSCTYYRTITEQISHFATFPEEIPTVCILAGSRHGDVVLDPFNGAGTVGVVCAKTGREYIGIELNPKYVEMANRRIGNVAPLFNQEATA